MEPGVAILGRRDYTGMTVPTTISAAGVLGGENSASFMDLMAIGGVALEVRIRAATWIPLRYFFPIIICKCIKYSLTIVSVEDPEISPVWSFTRRRKENFSAGPT